MKRNSLIKSCIYIERERERERERDVVSRVDNNDKKVTYLRKLFD